MVVLKRDRRSLMILKVQAASVGSSVWARKAICKAQLLEASLYCGSKVRSIETRNVQTKRLNGHHVTYLWAQGTY